MDWQSYVGLLEQITIDNQLVSLCAISGNIGVSYNHASKILYTTIYTQQSQMIMT